MRDGDIRAALVASLHAEHVGTDTVIRHEVGVCAGKRRIDLAVLNGEFAGYEIKSDEDRLTRLEAQAAAYAQVLDRAFLVTTARYVDQAAAIIPRWWGLIVAVERDKKIVLEVARDPGLNIDHDAFALAQLLWRDEALEALRERGEGRGLSGKARHYVWLALSTAVPVDELRSVVRERLKARPEWPGGQPHAPHDETCHTPATPMLAQRPRAPLPFHRSPGRPMSSGDLPNEQEWRLAAGTA